MSANCVIQRMFTHPHIIFCHLGNIFISHNLRPAPQRSSDDDGFEDEEFEEGEIVYKIGKCFN